MPQLQPSARLHRPGAEGLLPLGEGAPAGQRPGSPEVAAAIRGLIIPKTYPCVPAVQSHAKHEYLVGLYGQLGQGEQCAELAQDLLFFREQQKQARSLYLSFWAVFCPASLSEEQFEQAMWRELSYLSAEDSPQAGWDPNFSSDPAHPRFCFSLGGEAFFVVGLHAESSRLARRFPFPAVVFNLYEQFEELDRRGQYTSTVRKNREREVKFQGNLNPMVEQYADRWESIQFSGRDNPPEWKCPFQHGLKPPGRSQS